MDFVVCLLNSRQTFFAVYLYFFSSKPYFRCHIPHKKSPNESLWNSNHLEEFKNWTSNRIDKKTISRISHWTGVRIPWVKITWNKNECVEHTQILIFFEKFWNIIDKVKISQILILNYLRSFKIKQDIWSFDLFRNIFDFSKWNKMNRNGYLVHYVFSFHSTIFSLPTLLCLLKEENRLVVGFPFTFRMLDCIQNHPSCQYVFSFHLSVFSTIRLLSLWKEWSR